MEEILKEITKFIAEKIIDLFRKKHQEHTEKLISDSYPEENKRIELFSSLKDMRKKGLGYHEMRTYLMDNGFREDVSEKLIVEFERESH